MLPATKELYNDIRKMVEEAEHLQFERLDITGLRVKVVKDGEVTARYLISAVALPAVEEK